MNFSGKAAFPGVEGFSYHNLYCMRAFYLAYPDEAAFVTQPVSQIPWGHNIVLMQKVKDEERRLWYAGQSLEHGWSRAVLEHQMETGLYERQGTALTNYSRTLPPIQSDLAQQVLKDPYNFDFLTPGPDAQERHLERGLLHSTTFAPSSWKWGRVLPSWGANIIWKSEGKITSSICCSTTSA